jgi:hypothetical protein
MPMNRTVADAISNTLVLQTMRVENRAALECRMATTFTARRGGHQCDNCLKGSRTSTQHRTLDTLTRHTVYSISNGRWCD